MPFRTAARLGTSALLTAALLPLASPTATAEPAPKTETVHVPLREVTAARSGAHRVRTDTPFKMVGLTWSGADPDRIEVRTRTGGGWGAWTPLETLPESRATEALWTGSGNDAEVRAFRDRRNVTAELEFVGINPPATAPSRTSPGALPGAPPVITRAQWGADESKMIWRPERTRLEAAAVHHTAGSNDYSCADSASIVRGIYQYHAVELGWGDIGYHALVDKCGTIYQGRAGGLAGNVVGGHAGGFNEHTFGVSMMGNYHRVDPSPKTLDSVSRITEWKLSGAGVRADDRVRLTSGGARSSKYPAGTSVELPAIFAHRDVSKTVCPGRYGYAHLGEIRSRVADLQRAPQP
ncbi:hypothetical protein GCM10009854_06650 [Saccharopolyspora halophila]|uniref:N-acetylmuramoyl-L-alanine amidase n=1 Tax=Saccharopolyspora halophila TaxID=405551 RepID=A0ABN3FN70_9PSEU